jgi:hypothetical protein
MKLRQVLLLLRAAVFIVAAAFVSAEARDYFARRWDLSISPQLYAVLASAFVWIVISLSTRRLFRELRADAEAPRPQIAAHQLKAGESRIETVHRYPLLMRYPVAAVGLYFVALPYFSVEPGKSIALVTYAGPFSLAFFMLAVALYMFAYSVTLKHDRIIVQVLGRRREIAFSDMADTKVVRTRNGRQIVVTLKNGEIFRFGGRLTGFSTILDALTAQTPQRTD